MPDTKQILHTLIISKGYEQRDHGYIRVSKNNTHWITIFNEGELQMYAYMSEDEDCDKIYDTGTLDHVSDEELDVLVGVFIRNHF